MLVLGIESTAHTFGAGIVRDGIVLSNVRKMYTPQEGGIHPREAADHHVRMGPLAVSEALASAGVGMEDLELVSFSKGPGLGPCLRIGASIARAVSLKCGIPIIGANHCVAHLEIGQMLGCRDPVLLYASGGNTQVIAHVKGKYRVLGETLDIGIGNMLDKFGRDIGLPFPAGPVIERTAKGNDKGTSVGILDLPYSVKGMDVSFSGILTAARAHRSKGADPALLCRSVQEIAFSMLCEVSERAMAHIGADELLLGGGVACNTRLQEMAGTMVLERGGRLFCPPKDLLVDNGAMMAHLGEVMYEAGVRHTIEDTAVDQRFRTDQVDVVWKEYRDLGEIRTLNTSAVLNGEVPAFGSVIGRGAEAVITVERFGPLAVSCKRRTRKGYRDPQLDSRLVQQRVRSESRMLRTIRGAGVRTPYIIDVDEERGTILMELVRGPRLSSVLNVMEEEEQRAMVRRMGCIAGRLHANDMVHGDMTTSNFLVAGGDLVLIDCSLSERSSELEKKGVDLRLFFEVFGSTHGSISHMEADFREGYVSENPSVEVWEKLAEINSRGRYLGG